MEKRGWWDVFQLGKGKKDVLIRAGLITFMLMLGTYVVLETMDRIQVEKKQIVLEKYLRGREAFVYGAHNSAPPLRFVDKDGVYKGVTVDYMSQLSLELGVEIRSEPYGWEEALSKLKEGETDFCDMFISPERGQDYVFTDPVYNLRTVLLVKGETDFSFEDIAEMRIATEKGDYANSYMQQEFPTAKLVFVKNVEEGMDALLRGEADAVIGDEPIVSYYMGEKDGQFRMINTALYEKPVVLGMPKTYVDMIPIMNDAIRAVGKKGQLEKIQQKWFGISAPLIQPNSAKIYLRWALLGGSFMVGLLGLISWSNRSLKKQVCIRTKELEESKNELQIIFDSIPEYILMIDKGGTVLNANKGILDFAQLRLGQCVGASCDVLLKGFGLDFVIVGALPFAGALGKLEVKTGRDMYQVQKYPLTELSHGMLVTLRNITLDEINKKQLLQSSKMLAVGQLAGGMAHQIRNPLSVIRMHSYMLRESQNLGEGDKKSLTYIDENVQKAGGIIDNVMNFWRVSGTEIVEINLCKSFHDMIALHDNLLKKKAISVEINCQENLNFLCNVESLKHIFANLIANAIDAMEGGQCLTLGAWRTTDGITMVCKDTGGGIAQEHMENLFNPFFTTKELGKGTGLGLFVVYSEVEKLGGEIKVESKVGEGTCFTIHLPEGNGGTRHGRTI